MEVTFNLDPQQRQEMCEEIASSILAKITSFPSQEADRKYTKKEAADFLSVTEATIDDWRRLGFITSQKLGNRVYFRRSDLINAGVSRKHYCLK